MRQTHGTKANPPAVARKPGKFVCGGSGIPAPSNIFETTNLKDKPVRIGKGVPVRSLHGDTVDRPGERLAALAAKYVFFLLRQLIFGRFFNDDGFAFYITRLIRRDAQTIYFAGVDFSHNFSMLKNARVTAHKDGHGSLKIEEKRTIHNPECAVFQGGLIRVLFFKQ
jgi:hypothetical protein